MKLAIALAFALLLAMPASSRAQTPADSAAVLLGVATQLKAEGNHALSNSILDIIVKRFANTPAAQEAARLRTTVRMSATEPSGRTELMVFGTAYGLWLGAAVPGALNADNPTAYGVGLIVGAPTGFLAARSYSKSREITVGQARAITFGGTWGTWQGFGWAEVLDFGSEKSCTEFGGCYTSDPSGDAVLKSMIVGGLAGIGVGTALSHKNITAGTATTVNFGGLWGSWYGGALAAMMDVQGENTGLRATLIGGNAGIVAAALLAPKWQLTRQRARLISITGVAGLVGGFGVLLITRADQAHSIAVPIATSAAGLALGAYWTRGMDRNGGGEGLLEGERKRFGLELPSVQPRVLERVRNGRLERVPALGVTLFQARF